MENNYYLGMTAYIREEWYTNESLAVLGQVIPALHPEEDLEINEEDYQNIVRTDVYGHLRANKNLSSPSESVLPKKMPVAYHTPQIERVNVNGYNLVRLYIPVVATNETETYRYAYSNLLPVLSMLFGSDIICVKSRTSAQNQNFAKAREEVIISTKYQAPAVQRAA